MLFRNDIFTHENDRYRFLHADAQRDIAWIISLDDTHAWPVGLPYAIVQALSADEKPSTSSVLTPTPAMVVRRDKAYERLRPIVSCLTEVYDKATRGPLVEQRSRELGCSKTTIYSDLRRWFQGGQVPDCLLAKYNNSGRRASGITGGRGRPPSPRYGPECGDDAEPRPAYLPYQLTEEDLIIFRHHLNKPSGFLRDERVTQSSAYQRLLEEHYSFFDGNGDSHIHAVGNRPTRRQFTHFLRKQYSLEAKLRGRKGDKEFELHDAAKVGSVLDDCRGVGHYYEIDATIVDCFLVSASDVKNIIGKPTLYLVMDRKSRLIVGFYCGLENASWTGAMQAILSIATDKRALCERYEVKYHADDWPADKVFPREFLADRGPDQLSGQSSKVCSGLGLIYTNLPSKMAKWKPIVECGFKLTHQVLADVVPGYDPVRNASKRQGKHYDKDACLTLDEFVTVMLRTIIAHNRKAMLEYNLTIDEINAGILPTPIQIWNHDIPRSSGNLTRYTEAQVRRELLPRGKATITNFGVKFKDCYYTCPEGETRGWFLKARQTGRIQVTVSFDYRLANTILIHSPDDKPELIEARLTSRSEKFAGRSFAEIKYYIRRLNQQKDEVQQNRHQNLADYHKDTDEIARNARARLAKAGSATRSTRKADTKSARNEARYAERQEYGRVGQAATTKAAPRQSNAANDAFTGNTDSFQPSDVPITTDVENHDTSLAALAQEQRRKMLHGSE